METDDAETVRRIRETVLDMLEEMDMAGMVRAAAAERLGMDLSLQHRRELVRSVIDSFLESLDCDGEEEQDQVKLGEEKETELEEKEDGDRYDDAEAMKRIVETVRIVLEGSDDMSCVTEDMVYAAAAEWLGMDLSVHPRRKFVQCVIDSFLNSFDCDEKKSGVLQEVKRKDEMRGGGEEEMEVEKKEEGIRRVLGKGEDRRDDAETMERIEGTVRDILKGADLYSMTDAMMHAAAAERLRMDLSLPHRNNFVQKVIDSFLDSLNSDEEKAAVVQEKAREVEQGKVQEGRKRKRMRPRVRRRRSKMREQSENTVTAVVAGTVQKAAREEGQDKAQEGRRRRRRMRMQWREQNGNAVRLVKGGLHCRSSEGRHPFQFASSMEQDGMQLPTSIGMSQPVEQREAFSSAVVRIGDATKRS